MMISDCLSRDSKYQTSLSIPIFPEDNLKGFDHNLSFVKETCNSPKYDLWT